MENRINIRGNYYYNNHANAVRYDNLVIFGFVTDDGYSAIAKYNEDLDTTDIIKLRKFGWADDHNVPSLTIDRGGVLHIFYTGHNQTNFLYYAICNDIEGFTIEHRDRLDYGIGICYPQAYAWWPDDWPVSNKPSKLFVILRGGGVPTGRWMIRHSEDNGKTWSDFKIIVEEPETYIIGRQVNLGTAQSESFDNFKYVNMGLGYHRNPRKDAYVFRLNMDNGDLTLMDGSVFGNVITGAGLPFAAIDLEKVYEGCIIQGIATENGSIMPRLTVADMNTKHIEYVYYDGTAWVAKKILATNYDRACSTITDGDSNTVFLGGRTDRNNWFVKRLKTQDDGDNWDEELLFETGSFRPVVTRGIMPVKDGRDIEALWNVSYFDNYGGDGKFHGRMMSDKINKV